METESVVSILQRRVSDIQSDLNKVMVGMADAVDKYPGIADDVEKWWKDMRNAVLKLETLK